MRILPLPTCSLHRSHVGHKMPFSKYTRELPPAALAVPSACMIPALGGSCMPPPLAFESLFKCHLSRKPFFRWLYFKKKKALPISHLLPMSPPPLCSSPSSYHVDFTYFVCSFVCFGLCYIPRAQLSTWHTAGAQDICVE